MKTATQYGKHGTSTILYIQTWYGSAQECQRSHSHWEKPQAKGSETGDASSGGQNEAPACQVLERGVADDVVGVGEAELGEGGVVHQVQQGVGSDVGGGHIEDHQLLQLLHPLQAGDLIATEALEQLTKQQIGIGTGYKAVQWQWNTLQSSTVALEHITKQHSVIGTCYKTAHWHWNTLQNSTVASEQVTKQHSGIGTCYKTNSTVVLEQVTKQTAQWYWNRLLNKQHSGIGTGY